MSSQSETQVTLTAGLDRAAKVPIYDQIYLELKKRIRMGYYDDRQFPSSNQACAEFNVSTISVRRAFKRLHQEALISMSRGRDTVIRPKHQEKKLNSNLDALLTDINLNEWTTSTTVIDHKRCEADDDVCAALGCAPGSLVEQSTRLREIDGSPFSYVQVAVPIETAKIFGATTFEKPISAELMKQFGFEVLDVEERITACIADREISKYLEIPDGAPVLKILRTFYASTSDAILCTVGYYRSDKYEYGGRRMLPSSWQGV